LFGVVLLSDFLFKVVVRVRPLSSAEKEKRHFQCVFQLDKQRLLLVDPEKYENNILRQNRQHERQFSFDAAFGPNSSQMDIHKATTSPLVDSVVEGYNATVFAYGATGKLPRCSGKTFTMIGTKERPGLMSLLTQSLYQKINLDEYQVQLSYLEIYNEVIRDLLSPSAGVLDLMEDDKGNIRVPGLSTVRAPNLARHRVLKQCSTGLFTSAEEITAYKMI
ncbi:kinesin motor domain protein, partial [Ancylostoma caninum]